MANKIATAIENIISVMEMYCVCVRYAPANDLKFKIRFRNPRRHSAGVKWKFRRVRYGKNAIKILLSCSGI